MIKIEPVTNKNFENALAVYIPSWQKSHRHICTEAFLEKRDYAGYLKSCTEGLYLASCDENVGVFRIYDGTLSDLYIHPDHARKGYGTACVRFAIEKDKNLRLTVLSTNIAAIRLYKKMGFENLGTRKNFYEHPQEDAYIMRCDLV